MWVTYEKTYFNKNVAVLVLSLTLSLLALSLSLSPVNAATFKYSGLFQDANVPRTPLWRYDWIEGSWEVEIEANLEQDMTISSNQWIRYYSIKSVSFLIPFRYLSYKPSSSGPPTDIISENFVYGFNTSNFNLSFNLQDIFDSNYNSSFIVEYKGIPSPGDILLLHYFS